MNNWKRPNKPELDATKVPTDIDIAWAAGIYEGEGNCRLCGKTKRGFMLTVSQKDPELLYRLREWFGGNISWHDNGYEGGIHHWDCCGDRGRLFVALVYKFMTARRKSQIDEALGLEFLEGASPVGMTILQLKDALNNYYEKYAHRYMRIGRIFQNKLNAEALNDPKKLEELLGRVTHYKKDMTPEEKALYSKHQHERYLRRKEKQQLQLVSKEKVA